MRLILDLQACQTASRSRGIGRYVGSLAQGILRHRGSGADTQVALDGSYREQAARVRGALRDLLPAANFSSYHYPRPVLPEGDSSDPRRDIASQLIARQHAAFVPDAVLHGSVFEGYVEPVVTCEHLRDIPGSAAVAVVYDLIPLLYPDGYLGQARAREWYFRKLQVIRNYDLLLAISDSTRRDVIDRLGFPADRIAVIDGAADPIFGILENARKAHEPTLRRFGITRQYVLYTGNDDFRKNLRGALEAFARLPSALRRHYQLVLNQADRQHVFGDLLKRFGLAEDEVVVTGYVDDRELVILFNCCDLFLFPSLYEGFGLPVLEAMACGAPVIGGDNSAITELIDCPEARFDAADPGAIAACMERVLTDANLRQELCERGLRRARELSWERSARLALGAIEESVRRKRGQFSLPVSPRRRLALFTPLPPERTGIANYSAELLPHLARNFAVDVYTTAAAVGDVALHAGFRVRPWQEYEVHAREYDGVVYQIGNSPYHSHMLDLLAQHPGVVVLHDFFLSSAFWFMERHGGRPGAFSNELAYCHGAEALRDLERPDGDEFCRRRYPCNRRVLERSLGVISHSPGIHALLARYHLDRVAKPVRVTRHLRALPAVLKDVDCNEIRSRLGYRPDEWLVCSFGFIADTKLSHQLIQAVAQSDLSRDDHVHLVFIGELDGGAYGRHIREIVAASGVAERIRITGFVENSTYQDYLSIADVAVQLRSTSRGETSGAVLDCLGHGVPVIVNAHGTMIDYPDSVVVRLSEQPSPVELAASLTRLYEDPDVRRRLGAEGRDYVAREHSPAGIAADYAAAIEEMLQRNAYLEAASLARDIAAVVVDQPDAAELIELAGNALSKSARPNPEPTLIVDLSEVVHIDYGTGIHRVVRNLCRELIRLNGSSGYRCLPAFLDGAAYRVATAYARDRLGVAILPDRGAVEFAPGDALLLLDSAWSTPDSFLPVMRAAEDHGAEIIGYVYDLVPIRHPETCGPEMPAAFRRWLEHTVRMCHAIVCISRATADDLIAFISENHLEHRPGLRIHYAHLGSNLEGIPAGEPAAGSRAAFADDDHRMTFLMVGTLEPRKGHEYVLEAFQQLWDEGLNTGLCLVGKTGWKMEHFTQQLCAHPEMGRRLHWLQYAGDADVDYAYRHAAALVQASTAEGFGLPLLEAARHGTPVLCSELPVFREVAGDGALYFEAGSAEALAQLLRRVAGDRRMLSRRPIRERTWRDAAKDLLQALAAQPGYRVLE